MTAENRRFLLPPIINRILTLLTEQGFAAYVVGGAVRDLLLGKAPGDFDVATSARPESVISILEPAGFTVVGELGQNFGVVVVHRDSQTVEIATFRGEACGGARVRGVRQAAFRAGQRLELWWELVARATNR